MNYMNQIAKMLGVELDEEFYLEDVTDGGYYITYDNDKVVFKLSNLGMLRKDKHTVSGWIDVTHHYLPELFTGRYTIVKKPWKPTKEERYWYVLSDRYVVDTTFDPYCCYDLAFYTFGNCFRTKEEITPEVLEETWQKCYGAYFQDDKQDGAQQ